MILLNKRYGLAILKYYLLCHLCIMILLLNKIITMLPSGNREYHTGSTIRIFVSIAHQRPSELGIQRNPFKNIPTSNSNSISF